MTQLEHQETLTRQVFTLVDLLWSYGMDEVVISPGSRSTPIALAAELHPEMKTYIHPDERSAAFFALGLSKVNRSPVGIICTSGTASANFTPAVAEASLSHIPLVALTADRPHELRDIGAPQAINQENMFRNYVKFYTELPLADSHPSNLELLENKVLQCSRFFTGIETGPVHFNIPVREPLTPDMSRTDLFSRKRRELPQYTVRDAEKIVLEGNGLVILGETSESFEDMKSVLGRENLTLITDPRQHLRIGLPGAVTHHDLIFNALDDRQREKIEKEVDFILRIGEPVTSKSTNRFLSETNIPQYLFSEYQVLKLFPVSPEAAYIGSVGELLERTEFSGGDDAFTDWFRNMDDRVGLSIRQNVEEYEDEGRYMYEVLDHTDQERAIFLSNSMPIRDGERYDVFNGHHIYANRGANGIDGVVSTAIAMGSKMPMTLVIGDIALYHDMNGLIMSKLDNIDINIIVFNNNGGGIFSFLPQYEDKDHFERLFGTPLDLDFRHTAALYDFDYVRVDSVDDIDHALMNKKGRNIIEIITGREENLEAHQDLRQRVEKMVKTLGT